MSSQGFVEIEIDTELFNGLQEMFERHQASDSVYQYTDVEDMLNHILDKAVRAQGGHPGSEKAALLNLLNISET